MKKNTENPRYTIADLPALEEKLEAARNAVLASKEVECFYSFGDNEIDYLMSGHATEVIETIKVRPKPPGMRWEKWWELKQGVIYGVVGKHREENRYIWFYLRYRGVLIRCNSLKDAYDKAELLKAWLGLDDLVDHLQRLKYRLKEKQKEEAKKLNLQGSSLQITKKLIKPATVINKKSASKKVA